jgi:transglutaminase-like putative cysteine protease
MHLSVRHLTRLAIEPQPDRCALRLRLYPSAFEGQKLMGWKVSVNGSLVPPLLTTGFGDRESIWSCDGGAGSVEIVAEGEVETKDCAGFVKGLKEAARPGVYLRETPLTQADARLEALAKSVSGTSALDRMHALCRAVHAEMAFKPADPKRAADGCSAAQALKAGEGAAGDHAHVFLSAARVLNAPARYVVGYLFAPEAKGAELHAWAEAYVPELGWVGFDAACRLCPTDAYVRLASGLDSADALPIRSNVFGRTADTASASVDIAEIIAQSQSQTQQ